MAKEKDHAYPQVLDGDYILRKGKKIALTDDKGFYHVIVLKNDTKFYIGEPNHNPPPCQIC